MQGAKDLVASERGLWCLFVLVAVTVLAVMKIITGATWVDFAKWLTLTLVASKTATGVVETLKTPPPSATT